MVVNGAQPVKLSALTLSITTAGENITVIDAVDEQPLLVPVTVYTVVVETVAVTSAAVGLSNPPVGDHEYVVPPWP